MSIIGSNILAGASGQAGYNLNNSLRFRQSAIGYLSRTPASASNRRTWTWSGWVKLGVLGTDRVLFSAGSGATDSLIYIASGNTLYVNTNNSTNVITNALLRDPSAWYHIVVAFDTTQATAANRVKVYINGTQQTFTGGGTLPTQNTDGGINNNIQHLVGGYAASTSVISYDGYMTEVNFIDGSQLTPSSFGETSLTTGQWIPKAYSGSYGTNGFKLNFSDTSAATAAAIGKDSSGNGNNWTPSGISVSAGVTYDAMIDVPTNTSATVGNYAVMNPVGVIRTTSASLATFAGANLNVSGGAAWFYAYSSIAIPIGSGKYYAEFTINTSGGSDYIAVGINPVVGSFSATAHSSSEGGVWYSNNATKWLGSTNSAYGASYTANDIIGVAVDSDASTITFYKNNTSQTLISFNSNLTSNTFALLGVDMYNSSISANFGQRPFSYTPPTGFVALNTYNLPTPTILQGNKYMDATLYTGTNVSNAIVNQGQFKPDLVWIKARSVVSYHGLVDSVRGRASSLFSNATDAEGTSSATQDLVSFNSNGFTVGVGSQFNSNGSGNTLVGWQWQAGQGSSSSNTSGTITSTVSVNTTAGFSVVNWTGSASASAQTVGHGLGVTPKMVILKNRSVVDNWFVYHSSVTANNQYLNLNSTSAVTTAGSNTWGAGMTPTLVGLRPGTFCGSSSDNVIMYCWAEIAGFSKFGSYTGNGSTDGVFVYTGFRPKWVLIKHTNVGGNNWRLVDTSRLGYNADNYPLFPSLSDAESATVVCDLLSNGIKFRTTAQGANGSGDSYIYAAFAESPFKNSLAR